MSTSRLGLLLIWQVLIMPRTVRDVYASRECLTIFLLPEFVRHEISVIKTSVIKMFTLFNEIVPYGVELWAISPRSLALDEGVGHCCALSVYGKKRTFYY